MNQRTLSLLTIVAGLCFALPLWADIPMYHYDDVRVANPGAPPKAPADHSVRLIIGGIFLSLSIVAAGVYVKSVQSKSWHRERMTAFTLFSCAIALITLLVVIRIEPSEEYRAWQAEHRQWQERYDSWERGDTTKVVVGVSYPDNNRDQ